MSQLDHSLLHSQRRAIWGWALYDWSNSVFVTTVMIVFFPILYKQYWSMGLDANLITFRLGMGNTLASLLVALMAPILGAIADRGGYRKRFLIFFTYTGVLMTAALALIGQGHWFLSLAAYVVGIISYGSGAVFYDAMLPQVAPVHRLDQISSLGYALGYLGGGILLTLNVAITLKPHFFGFQNSTQAIQAAFVTVALWWGIFALITFAWMPPDPKGLRPALGRQIATGWQQLRATFKSLRQLKTLCTFLLAYWCYIDGVSTIGRMAMIFGISIGFGYNDLIIAFLITQFIGFPSALAFGALGKHWGTRRAIYLALAIYIVVTLWSAFMENVAEFYVLAATIGLVMGGVQALSRSYFTRMIPKHKSGEFFGLYNVLGKFAAIVGPALMGATGLVVKNLVLPTSPSRDQLQAATTLATRSSIASILVLFIAGAAILYFVDEKKGEAELKRYVDATSHRQKTPPAS